MPCELFLVCEWYLQCSAHCSYLTSHHLSMLSHYDLTLLVFWLSHVSNLSGDKWRGGGMDYTGTLMIITLKVISVAMDYQDGLLPPGEVNSLLVEPTMICKWRDDPVQERERGESKMWTCVCAYFCCEMICVVEGRVRSGE